MDIDGFNNVVRDSLRHGIRGSLMMVLWKKLKRLQTNLRRFGRPLTQLKQDVVKAKEDLMQAQIVLTNDIMNDNTIERVKVCIE